MSNSSLVSYTNLSPNHSGRRNHAIDTISVHCMAGNLTVEACGALFASPSRRASSNYGIGSDGRIGLYVDEGNRSWCTSSSSNDNRAVTIEVANNGGADQGWPVSMAAYNALINLLADICRRNGIKKLVWSTSKNDRTNHLNGCNMTVHRDFAAKSCPGDYLYNHHGQIAAAVNKKLEGEDEEVTQEQFDAFLENWLARKAREPASGWAEPYIEKVVEAGAFTNTGTPETPAISAPRSFVTREELATVAAALIK